MATQQSLDLGAVRVDLNKLVTFNPDPSPSRWVVNEGSKRKGMRGKSIGTICLRHAQGYEVLLLLDDGRIDSFAPVSLFPEPQAEASPSLNVQTGRQTTQDETGGSEEAR